MADTTGNNDAASTHHLHRQEHDALWHLAFFTSLASRSKVIPSVVKAFPSDSAGVAGRIAAAYNVSLLEAFSYTKAGDEAQRLLQTLAGAAGGPDAGGEREQPRCWMSVLSDRVRHHAAQIISHNSDTNDALATLLQETQRQHESENKRATQMHSAPSPCDSLFVSLAAEYLSRSSLGGRNAAAESTSAHRSIALFQLEPVSSASAGTQSSGAERSATVRQQQRQWYEARLYGALACATSIATPGPLARLLVAYAHANDGRLRAAADDNLNAHLCSCTQMENPLPSATAKGLTEEDTPPQQQQQQQRETKPMEAAAQARVRLSGIVAGVLEYTLHMARTRSLSTVAALHSAAASPASASASSTNGPSSASRVSQSAALLLMQITEECGFYQQAAVAPPSTPTAAEAGFNGNDALCENSAAAATAIVHAVQELLFTVVLGGSTQSMQNRPNPAPAKKPAFAVEASLSTTAHTAVPLLVTTTRGVSLTEADAIAQELFPALVQQLGMEWTWSPLLRHLSELDKLQPSTVTPSSTVDNNENAAAAASGGSARLPRVGLPVRWSSRALIDMVLLTVARKVYPQRLLNILPGSFERLLQNLDLLPPMRPQGDDGADAASPPAATRGNLFDSPAYYAEPVSALVSYFQRAGISGLRLEEVGRVLFNATNSYAMIVRLKAQAPPLTVAGDDHDAYGAEEMEGEDEGGAQGTEGDKGKGKKGHAAHAYVLSRERVSSLVSRYQGEVLLAAVVVHTQLRIPSQVQQLMRALAPLFLKIQLDWRRHHDGSVASWLLQHVSDTSGGTRSVRFSGEAIALFDNVGYEFYPLEWLPAVASSVSATSSQLSMSNTMALPYSLCAAVGHQFGLQLRGTPLGGSGDATLRHPAGPRTSVVMPSVTITSLLSEREVRHDGGADTTVAAYRRTERFLAGLMEVCYLDAKTSSTELEGTMAVSSTRRVLTTSNSQSQGSYSSVSVGGTALIAAADIAAQRLRFLLQQHAVMDAMWGSMEQPGATAAPSTISRYGGRGQERGQKRARSSLAPAADRTEAEEQLRSMRQLLIDYGAASFDTTVEAADFALVVAQGFLPSTAGMCAGTTNGGAPPGKRSSALLSRALEWSRDGVGLSSSRARVNMLLQQQQQQTQQGTVPAVPTMSDPSLVYAYNSATVDMAWLARRTLRSVPRRIWEKMEVQQAQARVLAEREAKWLSRLPASPATAEIDAPASPSTGGNSDAEMQREMPAASSAAMHRLDPLLMEQWTQWTRVWQQLGWAEVTEGGSNVAAPFTASTAVRSADDISPAQWLWYSPYFAAEWRQ